MADHRIPAILDEAMRLAEAAEHLAAEFDRLDADLIVLNDAQLDAAYRGSDFQLARHIAYHAGWLLDGAQPLLDEFACELAWRYGWAPPRPRSSPGTGRK